MIDKTREIALKITHKIEQDSAYSNIILNDYINKNKADLTSKDIGLISELTYGITTWKLTLDEIIKKHSKIKLKKISTWILNILRMGVYQIVFLDKIPVSAAVNESVNLAKKYGHKASSNFVNAILRKVTKQDYQDLFQIENSIEKISKTTSMPEWIVKELLDDGKSEKQVEEICINLNKKPKIIIRRNNLKISKDELEKELEKNKILYNNIEENNEFYMLENIRNIEKIDMFQKGYFTVQDLSAGMAAYSLNPQKGENILDACSAPGGKTTYLAEIMQNEGYIEAWDIHEKRTNLVKQNAERLGITIITTKQKDATIYDQNLEEKFDKILLDVPCMGIGVIKRKPDIKWQKKPEDISNITKIQEKILQNCSKYLKKGGTLVYSTCSILKKENENIINKFIKENSNFEIKNPEITTILPDELHDGFFITKITKK